MTKQHDFAERFAAADDPAVQARTKEILTYELDALAVERGNPVEDKAGVDFWAHLRSGDRVGVDIKNRDRDYDDVLLELVSVDTQDAPGWAVNDKYRSDYVLVLWPKRYLLIDYPRVRALTKRKGREYLDLYGATIAATEDRYRTRSVSVPIGRLIADIYGFPAPHGYPLTKPRLCPSCRETHPVGTTCAGGWAPHARALP